MNSDEVNSPASPSVSTSTGRRIRVRSLKKPSISHGASLPSLPSDDNDWVSPFTLPPLPAIKKNRSQADRSPEDRIHNRSGSSAYYAAAWGSPYATPSPNQSPAPRLNRNRSLDLESSPLATRKSVTDRSPTRHMRQQSLPSHDPIKPADHPSSPSPIDSQGKSQRRNWLSESEDSESEAEKLLGITPTQRKFDNFQTAPSSVRSHHIHESVDTITPETFNGASSIEGLPGTQNTSTNMDAQMAAASPVEDKPLPSLPRETSTNSRDVGAQPRPNPPLSALSFQRPKKKVPWKGKSCIIAMPLTDREQASLPPALTAQERDALLQKWMDLGYPIHGFSVGDWNSSLLGAGGASRPTYPDPTDMEIERKNTKVGVHIPNQAEWEAWVSYLKEEKLRALGVTPSTSEAPMSTHSPFSSAMSRVSSTYPSVAPSPPIPPMSAASIRAQMTGSPFSPALSNQGSVGYPFPQRGTPGLSNGRPAHGYTQSVAFPGIGQRVGSPFTNPMAQPGAYGNVRSPDGQMNGRRPWAPGHVQNMQSMANILSPVNPSPQDFPRGYFSNPQMQDIQRQQEAVARQQHEVQARLAAHHRQMSMFPLRAMSSEQVQQYPRTPQAVSPEREPPEIMHPTPRSHRHNLSAALEKGVTDSVATSTKELSDIVNADKQDTEVEKAQAEAVEEGEIPVETEQEELPILHRPETIKDVDDKAEIETNPSIASTPLLLDEQNPFDNFKPLPPPTKRTALGHSAQPSLSKLNVQAKEFSPVKAAFSPNASVFNFDGNAFASHTSSPGKSVASGTRFGHKQNPSSLGLNVSAPVFMPSSVSKPAEPEQAYAPTSHPPSARISRDLSQEDTPAKPGFNVQAPPFDFVPKSIPEEPTSEEPAFDPKSSTFGLEPGISSQAATPAKSTFDPRSSTFSFAGEEKSQQVTPAKSEFDPRSSTFSTFSFGSTGFNVEAPEFKPSGISLSNIAFTPEKPNNLASTGSIFGDVNIDPTNKPERRTKALPIVKPKSREGSAVPEEMEQVDEDGRALAPSDRHKRARTAGLENEEVLFADSAPFKSLDEQNDEEKEEDAEASPVDPVETIESTPEVTDEPEQTPAPETTTEPSDKPQVDVEVVAPEEATSTVDEVAEAAKSDNEPTPAAETIQRDESHEAAETSMDEREVTATEELVDAPTERSPSEPKSPAMAPTQLVVETTQPSQSRDNDRDVRTHISPDETVVGDADVSPQPEESAAPDSAAEASTVQPGLSAEAASFEPSKPSTEKSQSSLSATAQPFEFQPTVKDIVPEPTPQSVTPPTKNITPKPKQGGLVASKFAAPLSPEPEKVNMVERNSSPPQQLFGEREIETPSEHTLHEAEPTSPVSAMSETSIVHHGAEPVREDKSQTLEKYKEHDPQSPSVISQNGDLTYEEINAVMKQFEDDPDLGVIRDDSPVKSTPLVDMRYPQQFRSDAPSPSPNRRLDRPFDPDQERPYGGLGFDVSGVHQLNYGGGGEISDWNADLSPGQQDKLESRAKFFDDHVNDLVDNVLESRLAPLELALQGIQKSMQQASGKGRSSRRSMSTEKKDSDADDEDDYDAYEGYAHYRSRSPHRRDRRQEKIKAAVLEAMTVAQSTNTAPQIDTTFIQDALREMRELAEKAAAQPQPPAVDVSSIQEALVELRSLAQKEPKVPELDTSELTRTIAEMKSIAQQRAAEPQLDVQAMQATLTELRQLASEKPVIPEVDLSSIQQTLAELKTQAQEQSREQPSDLKTVLEDVIASHPRLRGSRVEAEHDSTQKFQVKIDDLEAMLKVAEKRADGEAALRREAEEETETLHRHLRDAQDQAALHKESSEEAQKSLESFLQEKNEYRGINNELRDLRDKNEALEKTLDEYRDYREQMKDELESERSRTDNLARALQDARQQHQDQLESRDVLREQLNRIQERMTKVMEDVHHDESEFRKKEHDLLSKNQLLQAALDHETNRRARMELDAEKLNKEHRDSLHFRSKHDTVQEEVSRLAGIIVGLQAENKSHQDSAYAAQRELAFVKERQDEMMASQTSRLQDELEQSRSMSQNLQSDSDARIARLQGQLDAASVELQESKARHEANMEKMFENHNVAIRHANERHASELDQRLAIHEDKLIDLRNQHNRDMHNANEDRKALEHRYEAKLELSDDKNKHLESKIKDLEHLLDVTKIAARAAADSAISKSANLPTPANSVIASPPHRPSVSGPSAPLQRGSDLPEKISPQALRETILVLQDQLQNREQKLDKLEAELAAIDKEAPSKVKERDTEIVMLRELLDVRIDDLQELIATLEKPDYNRTAVKDATIRLKTQIKMDQQLRERAISAASLANNLPSSITSGFSNLTQSPRAMVAAAAWGNWRKIRDSGVGSAVSDFANNIGSPTPTRSSSSPNALAGMMTRPATNKSSKDSSRPSTARPLAAAAAARNAGPSTPSSGARPLRSFSTQPRTLAGARPLARRGTNESTGSVIHQPSSMKVEPPSTPLAMNADSDFGDDVDEDASPLDGKDRGFGADNAEELVKPESSTAKPASRRTSQTSVSKSASPRAVRSSRSSRLSAGKPVSPRALRASAGVDKDDVVEVFEEN
ncbi:hypothetical protein PMZ80_001232 [Knufia obscura]|uniref:Uncharacterized protein n=1 Tax=Knufia obscura TaxID=1635080 RepID=A0ABR0S2N1_9EURO|nr:hypothetical protein PMZ80_001232 [Knufia obscura]